MRGVLHSYLSGKRVLFIHTDRSPTDTALDSASKLQDAVGAGGCVQLEIAERLAIATISPSTFDIAVFCMVTGAANLDDIFAMVLKALRPTGKFVLLESGVRDSLEDGQKEQCGADPSAPAKLLSKLRLSGFINISEVPWDDSVYAMCFSNLLNPAVSVPNITIGATNNSNTMEIVCEKPPFEVGASMPLSLKLQKPKEVANSHASAAKVWSLSTDDTVDDGVSFINSDDLLTEEDLRRPAPEAIRDCGTGSSGKKKACKNCTCGLAEEIDEAAKKTKADGIVTSTKSACGNCYLGDAFRCSGCPYLGMPAFKPGEKITLTDRQLKADV